MTRIVSTDIVVLNNDEKNIIENLFSLIKGKYDASILEIEKKLMDLERMSIAISRFPSIHETSMLAGEKRSAQTLIKELCKVPPDSRMLSMPTKAVLGRGFLVAKFHTFSALIKIASKSNLNKQEIEFIRKVTLNLVFTIMSEDVYISILDSNLLEDKKRKKVADALIYLWEHRLDQNTISFAPVLTSVWTARDKMTPVFGTMMGTSELFLLSSGLGESELWNKFLIEKLSSQPIGQSLEEFLFGISYEDIQYVRKEMIRKNETAISKEEVAAVLNIKLDFKNMDPKLFYSSYIKRKNNATARKRLNTKGPKNTLEDYYISFLFENDLQLQDQKKQELLLKHPLSSFF